MARVLIHSPLNISRTLSEMMKEFAGNMQERYGMEVIIESQPHRPEEESLFLSYINKEELPDLIVGHANDFADLPAGYLEKYFQALPGRYRLRQELADAGFTDPKGFFHTFAVVPYSILYNHNMLTYQELPKSWKDLLDSKWDKSILMPDEFRIVSVIVNKFMESVYPNEVAAFQQNVINKGTPMDVVNAVDEGQYPLGVANIAFARFSRHKNTGLVWPEDGAFCIPQIMVWSKGADERILEAGDFLLSRPVQEFMATQSFVPASPDTPLPDLVNDNKCSLHWDGWDHFLKIIKGAGD